MLKPSHSRDRYWEVMHNPVAGELGITTQQELDDFVDNAIPKFKAVIGNSKRETGGACFIEPLCRVWELRTCCSDKKALAHAQQTILRRETCSCETQSVVSRWLT